MTFTHLLSPERILCGADVSSKKRALQQLADLLCGVDAEPSERTVFDRLCGRERLGSTGLGNGIAIPHGRVPGLEAPCAALVTLSQGIDFDAIDDAPVDLLVGLLVPEDADEAHLQILATLATHLSDSRLCTALRRAESAEDVLALLSDSPPSDSAAASA